jgi:hypothetical protein
MSANAQTKATEKYQQKVGLISKSYKLKREIVDAYAACRKAGVSCAGQLTTMMQDFIQTVSESDTKEE